MSETGRVANVLGALALVLSDRTAVAVADASGQSGSSASALSALAEFLEHPTLDDLRKVLGLTPSGVVRLVDRLVDAGLVTRQPGADARSRAIVLTAAGRRVAGRIAAARMAALTGVLDGLTGSELASLDELLGRVMATVVGGKEGGAWICRQCDLGACGRAAGRCPAALAARRKYGGTAT